MKSVTVIIPIYKTTLSDYDAMSLAQTCKVLASYPLVVVHPDTIDVGPIVSRFPSLTTHAFPPAFFDGIMGYNRMMLSPDFYGAFLDYEYILICQTDAFILRDELQEWCNRGYDYVGAPWLRRKVYDLPIMKQSMQLSLWWKHMRGKRSKQELYDRVGNGGLSLRKVRSHYDVTIQMADLIHRYTDRDKKDHLYNEDVFWALEPQHFRYPSADEALMFAFDKYPDLCFQKTGGKLPFGCHAWFKRKMHGFWDRYIPKGE